MKHNTEIPRENSMESQMKECKRNSARTEQH